MRLACQLSESASSTFFIFGKTSLFVYEWYHREDLFVIAGQFGLLLLSFFEILHW